MQEQRLLKIENNVSIDIFSKEIDFTISSKFLRYQRTNYSFSLVTGYIQSRLIVTTYVNHSSTGYVEIPWGGTQTKELTFESNKIKKAFNDLDEKEEFQVFYRSREIQGNKIFIGDQI